MSMKKFSKKLIYHGIFTSFFLGLLIVFYLLPTDGEEFVFNSRVLIILFISYIIIVLSITIYKILYYNLSGYEIKDNKVFCKRGVIFKKTSILDFSKINSVNKKQGLIQKMFGISTLMVDSGSTNTAAQAEIIIIEDVNVVNKLYELLMNKDKLFSIESEALIEKYENKVEKENLYKFKSNKKLIYSLINGLYGLIVSFFISIMLFIILYLLYKYPEMNDEPFEFKFIQIIIGCILIFFVIYLISCLISIISTFIGYYNFKITKENDNINVEYGLFVNKHNTFSLAKVKAIIVHQNIFQRLFKFAQIRVEVIGYVEQTNDNKQGVIGILIPLCKLSEVDVYLEKIIPYYIPKQQKSHAISFISFLSWKSIFIGIADVLILIPIIISLSYYKMYFQLLITVISIIGVSLLTIVFIFIEALFAYRTKDIIIDEKNVIIHNGSFSKKVTVINKKDIIAIEDVTTYFRAKKGIYSYLIHFYTNSFSNVIKVDFKEEKFKEELLSLMKY